MDLPTQPLLLYIYIYIIMEENILLCIYVYIYNMYVWMYIYINMGNMYIKKNIYIKCIILCMYVYMCMICIYVYDMYICSVYIYNMYIIPPLSRSEWEFCAASGGAGWGEFCGGGVWGRGFSWRPGGHHGLLRPLRRRAAHQDGLGEGREPGHSGSGSTWNS